jgi:hypothetical protein
MPAIALERMYDGTLPGMPKQRELSGGRIQGADPDLWLELRLEATRRRVSMCVVWDEIMRDWLARRAAGQLAPTRKEPPISAAA